MSLSINGFPFETGSARLTLHSAPKATTLQVYRGGDMRHTLLLVLLVTTAASPAAAQSCATLGGGLDCGAAPTRPAVKPPRPALPGQDAESHGYSETTASSHGASTTLNNKVIDSRGIVEFGFSGSTRTPCRIPGYGSACQ